MKSRIIVSRNLIYTIVLFFVFFSVGCGSLRLAAYDQVAYENATSLKVETISLLNQVGPDCNVDQSKKETLLIKLEKAYEYANGVDYNNEAALNWRDQIDELFPDVYEACGQQNNISPVAFDILVKQVEEGFDTIICLEANKRNVTRCSSLLNGTE